MEENIRISGAATDNAAARILVITGMSGAGKSRAAMTLEDMGYFCVDNLPASLFGKFIEAMRLSGGAARMAIVADIRGGARAMPELEATLSQLRHDGIDFQIIFMEASDAILVRRYKENRRPHPLAQEYQDGITACIREERRLLAGLRAQADVIIDTTETGDRKLIEQLDELFGSASATSSGITISITSFGFKYGLPIDADVVMDVRFTPNPFYIPELKEKNGLDKAVADYVLNNEVTREFLRRYLHLLRYLLPYYRQEGKRHIMLAIGCTGGCHRSVAIATEIAKRIRRNGYAVTVHHRDIDRSRRKG